MAAYLWEEGTLLQKNKSAVILEVQICCNQTVDCWEGMMQIQHQLPCVKVQSISLKIQQQSLKINQSPHSSQ